MIKNLKDIKVSNYFTFLLVVILFGQLIRNLLFGYEKKTWNISEFLINYEGGYVRRGLLGQLLLWLFNYLGVVPYYLIICICFLSLFFLIIYFFLNFQKNNFPIIYLASILFFSNVIVNDFWVRKDIIILNVFILIVFLDKKRNVILQLFKYLLIIIGALIHESIIFLLIPYLFVKTTSLIKLKNRALLFDSGINLSLAIFLLLFNTLNKGNELIVSKIKNSWNGVYFPYDTRVDESIDAVDAIGWDLMTGLRYTFKTLLNFDNGIYAPLVILITILVVFLLLYSIPLRNNKSERKRQAIMVYSIVQFLAVLPLFLLGWDYARWFFLWTASTMILVFNSDIQIVEYIVDKHKISMGKIKFICDKFIFSNNNYLLLFILGIPAYSWNLLQYVKTTSAFLIINKISLVILMIRNSF
ncbi:hypothetical protein SAMN05660477_01263 [Soonwooa buanensis]|uniref:EpsG family protein n=1 Tax=Soonwooa buanensis TaxID=619805 RepID=A0A1T5EC29_9FLAO|nr:hypothetical protein [Soonwooa buanensis]SKB81339.1 hypothetical protein SAMN05660477_01263 [Soonwooa buanensis]